MKKKVLDTNVLLDRPLSDVVATFDEATEVIIPFVVLKELDNFKKGFDAINEHSRATTRFLDGLRKQGKLNQGVFYGKHIIRVDISEDDLDLNKNDYKIIKTAKLTNSELVSQDIHVRVVADALDIISNDFTPEHVNVEKLYAGQRNIDVTVEEASEFGLYNIDSIPAGNRRLTHNQFVTMTDPLGGTYEGIYKATDKRIHKLQKEYKAWNIKPKKDKKTGKVISEQKYLLHLLTDPSIEFVSAIGPSGCGKTFLTLAAALEQTLNSRGTYNKIVVMRPLVPIGNDIGFLPGDKMEKLEPWMASTFDALEYLLQDYQVKDANPRTVSTREKIEELVFQDKLELEAMAHIRGRSIPNQFIIVDDAQNLTQHQTASIITRAGEGSKVVFLGDISPKQIDNHRLTPSSNGLAYVVDRFKGEDIVGHITMETVVRSRLAQLGVEKL